MDSRTADCLQDILNSITAIEQFTADMSFETYSSDAKTQAATERKFEIIGEALNRIGRADDNLLQKISHYRDIISFRNILAHGYDSVDQQVVWGIITSRLSALQTDVLNLI